MARRYYNRSPYMIKARFDSKCAETGRVIKKGEYCVYYPMSKQVYCEDSKTAYDFRCMKADEAMGYNY